MEKRQANELAGIVLDEESLTLAELCRACGVSADYVISLVEEGIVEPEGEGPEEWQFSGVVLQRVRVSLRLQKDMQINLPGIALVLDLMEEVRELRQQVEFWERLLRR